MMEIEKKYAPSATVVVCRLSPGETLISEGGALMAMQGPVEVTTSTKQKNSGGIIKGLKRMISGESFFLNHFTATNSAEVWLGTPLPGDIMVHNLIGERLVIAGGGFVACSSGVSIDLQWQGFKSLFSGEGIFWVKASGQGQVVINSFGFIYPIDVDGEYIVDTGHIVAFEETLTFVISKASASWLDAFLSGEGFVCRFKGKGRVWCQSHNPQSYGQELTPYLKPRQK